MNRLDYIDAKSKLIDAAKRGDRETANAIRRIILYFYKPKGV